MSTSSDEADWFYYPDRLAVVLPPGLAHSSKPSLRRQQGFLRTSFSLHHTCQSGLCLPTASTYGASGAIHGVRIICKQGA
jgi:hypothetical protein